MAPTKHRQRKPIIDKTAAGLLPFDGAERPNGTQFNYTVPQNGNSTHYHGHGHHQFNQTHMHTQHGCEMSASCDVQKPCKAKHQGAVHKPCHPPAGNRHNGMLASCYNGTAGSGHVHHLNGTQPVPRHSGTVTCDMNKPCNKTKPCVGDFHCEVHTHCHLGKFDVGNTTDTLSLNHTQAGTSTYDYSRRNPLPTAQDTPLFSPSPSPVLPAATAQTGGPVAGGTSSDQPISGTAVAIIVIAVLILFGGLGSWAWYRLNWVPKRKAAATAARRQRRLQRMEEGRREGRGREGP